MHKIFLFQIISLLLIVSCEQDRPAELTDQNVKELKTTIQKQFQAMLKGDVKTLNRIFSNDYVMTSRKGAQLPKADWLQLIDSGRLKYLNIGERTDVSIKIYGTVAVERGLIGSTIYELDGERLETEPRRFMAIWIKTNKTWRQVARQHTAVAAELN